ncbi:unnamed protein product [Diabrotica balteata]|uniref:Uncharacterized protein n=1 Tax=Diabrotica balteata TaxID=107213 RepID=A0A9N9XHC0_DIABA|nr:unnamed protein product [Diabrotica balteata]
MDSTSLADNLPDDEFDIESTTASDVATTVQRLKEFAYYLVDNVEYILTFLLKLLEERQVPPKPTSQTVTVISTLFSVIPKIGSGISSGLKTGESYVFRKIDKKHARALAELVYHFSDNKEKFRYTIIEAAVEVFSNFELQLMKLTCNGGPTRAMQKLARDASDRIFDYFLTTEQDKNVTKAELTKGIIYGESKRNRVGKKEGKEVSSKLSKWKTCKLYSKVGIFITDSGLFYKNNYTNTQKYGYRKMFIWEDEDIIRKTWILDSHFEIPKYTLKVSEDLLTDIKEYIMRKAPFEEAQLNRQKYHMDATEDRQVKHNQTKSLLETLTEQILKITIGTEQYKNLLDAVYKNQENSTKQQYQIVTKLELVHTDVIDSKEKQEILRRTSENLQNDIQELKSNHNEIATSLITVEEIEQLVKEQASQSVLTDLKEYAGNCIKSLNPSPLVKTGVEVVIPKIIEGVEKMKPKIKEGVEVLIPKIEEGRDKVIPKIHEAVEKALPKMQDLSNDFFSKPGVSNEEIKKGLEESVQNVSNSIDNAKEKIKGFFNF